MDLPPSNHFIYIPVIFVLGIVLGFILGSRSTREAIRLEKERAEARALKREARRAAHARKQTQSDAVQEPNAGEPGASKLQASKLQEPADPKTSVS